MLAPDDMQKIGTYCDAPPSPDWVREHFAASTAMCVVNGEPTPIPTIVPAQLDDGRCVFLTEDDRCGIHPVAPFGCRTFNVCESPDTDTDHRSARALACVCGEVDYLAIWAMLKESGCEADSISIRQKNLRQALDRGNDGDHQQQ